MSTASPPSGTLFAGNESSRRRGRPSPRSPRDESANPRHPDLNQAPGTWRDLKTEAKAFGLSRLYAVDSSAPLKFGPRDSVWYIGTFKKNCLVTIGYANQYAEYGLKRVSELSVQVFNRYGGSRYLDANDSVRFGAVAKFVKGSADECR